MRILIDMGHPAHVHFFKNAIWELEKHGHVVKITARDKDVTLQLLNAYGFEYVIRPSGWRPLYLFRASKFIKQVGKEFGADVYAGVHNPYVAMAARSLDKKCILFTDSMGTKMANRFSVDRANVVCTPNCLANKFTNQVTYKGYKEMAYLHPNVYEPEPRALEEHGLQEGEKYYVVRFVAWKAYHDRFQRGMTQEERDFLVTELSNHGKVLVTYEGTMKNNRGIMIKHPKDMHTLLQYSSGFIGEGATTAKEAALLGVSSIYVSPIQGLATIEEMVKNSRIKALEKMDLKAIIKALENKPEPYEMYELNEEIIRLIEKVG